MLTKAVSGAYQGIYGLKPITGANYEVYRKREFRC